MRSFPVTTTLSTHSTVAIVYNHFCVQKNEKRERNVSVNQQLGRCDSRFHVFHLYTNHFIRTELMLAGATSGVVAAVSRFSVIF